MQAQFAQNIVCRGKYNTICVTTTMQFILHTTTISEQYATHFLCFRQHYTLLYNAILVCTLSKSIQHSHTLSHYLICIHCILFQQ